MNNTYNIEDIREFVKAMIESEGYNLDGFNETKHREEINEITDYIWKNLNNMI